MDAAGTVFLVLILIIVGLLILTFWLNNSAKRQEETQVKLSNGRVADIVHQAFGSVFWKDVDGPGDLNKRRRTINDTGPVVSIDINELEGGGSHVVVWMSHWTKKGPSILGSDEVMRKKRKVIRQLEQA